MYMIRERLFRLADDSEQRTRATQLELDRAPVHARPQGVSSPNAERCERRKVDVTGLTVGTQLHAKDIELPAGATLSESLDLRVPPPDSG